MKKFIALVALISTSLSMSANAGFISGNHTLSNGKTVGLQGLEWLPLSQTSGLSATDILNGFTDRSGMEWRANEFRYATLHEVNALLQSLSFSHTGWDYKNAAGARWFLETLGHYEGEYPYEYTHKGLPYSTLSSYFANFIYGGCGSDTKLCNGAVSWSLWNSREEGLFTSYLGVSPTQYVPWTMLDLAHPEIAHLLVRETGIPPASVAAPSCLGFWLLFLCGIALRYKRQLQY